MLEKRERDKDNATEKLDLLDDSLIKLQITSLEIQSTQQLANSLLMSLEMQPQPHFWEVVWVVYQVTLLAIWLVE